ncbi:MAG: preprotein translocase subunit SecA [Bradyrhizobium sp.]|nr:preprotein translocase subunit SecA [Bradyrhizobium sp.]
MSIPGMDEANRKRSEDDNRAAMERLSAQLKDLILSLPPRELLGYIWSTAAMSAMFAEEGDSAQQRNEINTRQFVLEYVHAVLASFPSITESAFDETICAEIFKVAEELRAATFRYCLFHSLGIEDGIFGEKTGLMLQSVQSNWVLMRGNRYGVLEEEFYAFALEPHDEALRAAYGIGAKEIAAGIQAAVDSLAGGHAGAVDQMDELMKIASMAEAEHGLTGDEVRELWEREHPEHLTAAASVYTDLFQGGTCNLSKHTKLPVAFLEDLAFKRGEHLDFFAPGPLSGTPLRTLPARMRPLVNLDGEFFATDAAFIRDSSYRALLWNLLQRKPDYQKEFDARQKDMSESAFHHILGKQLEGAVAHREIWYRDPNTRQWVENDLLVLIDDTLILVEAKSGAAATIASPATDFDRHGRAIHDLIVKAYDQCRRFLQYMHSAEEVVLYKREAGRYVQADRIRLGDFRVVLPIGLTVESFAPYSGLAKQFPGITPILGRYPFVSLSIDDLFALRRFLPTTGEMLHYFETRQAVAGIPEAILFDEMDHLGAYITKNRFDLTLQQQVAEGPDLIWWDGQSDPIDDYFAKGDIGTNTSPGQGFPEEGRKLLVALGSTREKGWLAVASYIRTFGEEGRNSFAEMLRQLRISLSQQVSRYFQFGDGPPLFVWLHRTGYLPDMQVIQAKAQAAAVAAGSPRTIAVLAYTTPTGDYSRVVPLNVQVPIEGSPEYAALQADVLRMQARKVTIPTGIAGEREISRKRMPRPNDPCWCGSGKKYKKCHRA